MYNSPFQNGLRSKSKKKSTVDDIGMSKVQEIRLRKATAINARKEQNMIVRSKHQRNQL
jgi:hypothetical protein